MKSAAMLAFLGALACTGAPAQEISLGRRMMEAAVYSLGHLTLFTGHVNVSSENLARSADGVVFRKLADCTYGLQNGKQVEFVDFNALTGRYEWQREHFGVLTYAKLTFQGTSPRTRCFSVGKSEGDACQDVFTIGNMPESDIDLVVRNVRFILQNGCDQSAVSR